MGSSNLSKSALVDGLERDVRIAEVTTPTLVRSFEATSDTCWNDPGFLTYDPDRDADLLDRSLAAEGGAGSSGTVLTISGLDVQARPHQQQMLEALDVERTVHDRHATLLVAATGTGPSSRRWTSPRSGSGGSPSTAASRGCSSSPTGERSSQHPSLAAPGQEGAAGGPAVLRRRWGGAGPAAPVLPAVRLAVARRRGAAVSEQVEPDPGRTAGYEVSGNGEVLIGGDGSC